MKHPVLQRVDSGIFCKVSGNFVIMNRRANIRRYKSALAVEQMQVIGLPL